MARLISPYERGRQPCRLFRPLWGQGQETCAACGRKLQQCSHCKARHHEEGWDDCPAAPPPGVGW